MFALHAASRTLLAAAAFASFGAAFVTTPIVARGDAGFVVDAAPPAASSTPQSALPNVLPRRDPFAGGDASARPNVQSPTATPTLAVLPQIPAALRALPPNAGAGDDTFPFATSTPVAATVTAVITGAHPFALVDKVGTTRVVTVGDHIGSDAVVAIGADGVRLASGTKLTIAPALALPPQAHPIPGGR